MIREVIAETYKNDLSSITSAKYNEKGSVRHLNEIKKEKIVSAIKDEKTLWIKIMTFSKIEIKDLKEVLNKKGIIIENEVLKKYMLELGVLLT